MKHKLLFTVFIALQFLVVSSVLFILSVFISNSIQHAAYDRGTRSFFLQCSVPYTIDLKDKIQTFSEEYSHTLDQMILNSDNAMQTDVVYPKTAHWIGGRGRYFSEKEFNDSKPLVILASQLQGNLTIGDFYEVNQVKMQIIGLDFSTTIVPFAYFPTNINIQNVRLTYTEKPTPEEEANILAWLNENFPNADIQQPAQRNYQAEQENILISGIAIIIMLFSVVNVAFLYQYVLKQRRKQIQAMQLCGASPGWCVGLFLAETLLLASAAYWLAALIGHLTFPLILNEAFYEMTYSLHFTHYLLFYGLYLLVVLLIFLRFIRRAIKIIRPVAKGETL